jgi:hypothetical protein
MAEDGSGQDVIVIGPRLAPGSRVEVVPSTNVGFMDAGRKDDKWVARLDGCPLNPVDHVLLRLFFWTYTALKKIRASLGGGPPSATRLTGFQALSLP